jgi:hypothetical protein
MTLYEHLGQLVRYAPPGTFLPVDSIAELLQTYANQVEPQPEPDPSEHVEPRPAGLSLGEVAERFSRLVDGEMKTVKNDTVRKWARVGLCGVRLRAFRIGRQSRVLEEDFELFVRELVAARPAAPRPFVVRGDFAAAVEASIHLHRQPPKTKTGARGRTRRESRALRAG